MDISGYPLVIVTFLLCLLGFLYIFTQYKRSKYPNGPYPLPLIGNLHLLSGTAHEALTKLSQQYGSVYTVWMGHNPTIVISDLQLSKVAMNNPDFGGRPFYSPFTKLLHHNEQDLITRQLDKTAYTIRKIALSSMKSTMANRLSLTAIVENEVRHFLAALKEKQNTFWNPYELLLQTAVNSIAVFLYGTRSETSDPNYIKWMRIQTLLAEAVANGLPTEVYPFLAHFLPKTKRDYEEVHELVETLTESHLREHEETFRPDNIRDLTDMMIKAMKEMEEADPTDQTLTRLNIRLLALNMVYAGTEATVGTLLWSFLLLLKNPETKERVQRELDTYLAQRSNPSSNIQSEDITADNNNLPSLHIGIQDREHLPVLNAMIYEVLRIRPLAPLSVPHRTMKETKLNDMTIPNGTGVMFNFYAMNMNPTNWENPEQFNIDRFLTKDGTLDLERTKKVMSFGLGKRSCLGENLGKAIFFYLLSNLLLNYDLVSPPDEILPSIDEGSFSVAFLPLPFKMKCQKRKLLTGQRYNN